MSNDPRDPGGELPHRPEDFIKTFFRRGAEFAEELLRGNERLRYGLLQLEARLRSAESTESATVPSETLRELLDRLQKLERERETLLAGYSAVQAENVSWKERYVEVERENANLANLYVASYQ